MPLLPEVTDQISRDLFRQCRGWARDLRNGELFEPGVDGSVDSRVPHKGNPEIKIVLPYSL
jgi:hypothetical protein